MKMHIATVLGISSLALSLGGCAMDSNDELLTDAESVQQARDALVPARFRLRSVVRNNGDKCIGIAGGTPTQGRPLITWDCTADTNQLWKQGATIDNTRQLVNQVSTDGSWCLDAGTGNNGSQAINGACTIGFTQGWKMTEIGMQNSLACYNISIDGDENQLLGVLGGTVANGKNVGMWHKFTNPTHADQVWCADPQ